MAFSRKRETHGGRVRKLLQMLYKCNLFAPNFITSQFPVIKMFTQEPLRFRRRFNTKGGTDMINRWKLKDCPRCGGDIFMDIDENGWLGHCLQCGYMGRAAMKAPEVAPEVGT